MAKQTKGTPLDSRQSTLAITTTPKQTEQNLILEEIRMMRTEQTQMRTEQSEMKTEWRKDMRDLRSEIKSDFKKEFKEIKETINTLSEEIKGTAGRVEKLEEELKLVQEKCATLTWEHEKDIDERALLELKMRENSLKIRGLGEQRSEDLRKILIPVLAKLIEMDPQTLDWEIDKIFRIGPLRDRREERPRDVLISCVRKSTRDRILQANTKSRIEVKGQKLQLYKDIPLRILQKRRDYSFLTSKLCQHGIQYRWARLEGVTFRFRKKLFVISSTQEAKDFLTRYGKNFAERMQQSEEELRGAEGGKILEEDVVEKADLTSSQESLEEELKKTKKKDSFERDSEKQGSSKTSISSLMLTERDDSIAQKT